MVMKEDLISIIIPVYNAQDYIEQTLECIQKQSYSNYEVILVDDGSLDNSLTICEKYASRDSRFRVKHQSNKGPSAARNTGINMANGKYLTFVDNDDLVHPDYLESLYEQCRKNDCDIALCAISSFVDQNSIPMNEKCKGTYALDNRELSEELLDMSWDGVSVSMAKLFSKELFTTVRYNEDRVIGDDDTVIYQLFWKCRKAVFVDQPLYFYRSKREGSITHSGYNLSWLSGGDALKERMLFYKEHGEKKLYAKAMKGYCRRILDNYLCVKEQYKNQNELLRNMRKEMIRYSGRLLFFKEISFHSKLAAMTYSLFPSVFVFLRLKRH